ncbi:MAG TPA: hypothetical protein PKI11_15370 [Candidatus Hydrogenedentes bacterium]|nr:hypothetical protein [Candidatus Hydrogenedentota bacterium]
MSDPREEGKTPRPFINMHFKCCNVYARVHLNHDGTAYTGHCPHCAAPITIRVAPGGSDAKFWSAE